VINGLSDSHHPCQALADLQTLKERFGKLKGLKLAYVGDGNNVLHSLLLMLPFVGVDVHYACPEGYQPDSEILERSKKRAETGGAQIRKFKTPSEAVQGVDAIYTDVWTSMGFEDENQKRLQAFEGYQINMPLLKKAQPEAIVLHCLPMIKDQEITQEVVDSPQSALFDQAENRLHAQKALMMGLYGGKH
jgi:ornithine carbamoyltransferase